MKRNWKAFARVLIAALVVLGMGAGFGLFSNVSESRAAPKGQHLFESINAIEAAVSPEDVEDETEVQKEQDEPAPKPKYVNPYDALPEYKHLCEDRSVVRYDDKGEVIPQPRRKLSWSAREKQRRDIAIVAYAMGMKDARPLWIPALREASYMTWKEHRLNPDKKAAINAWRNWSYSEGREKKLVKDKEDAKKAKAAAQGDITRAKRKLDKATPGTKAHDKAQEELDAANGRFKKAWKTIAHSNYWLKRIKTYKDNPTWSAAGRWNNGYGLYGMQPVYFVKRWDRNAPPEILCDGVISTIVQVWSARSSLQTCISQGYPATWETSNRVMASGHCDLRPKKLKHYRNRADAVGLDPQAPANFGSEWPSKTTDRDEIYEHMASLIELADSKCLSEDDIRKWKGPANAPDTCAEKEAAREKRDAKKAKKAKEVALASPATASG